MAKLKITGDTIGERIRSIMKSQGVSQEALAKTLKTKQSDVSKIVRSPDPKSLAVRRRYADALGVPFRDLIPD